MTSPESQSQSPTEQKQHQPQQHGLEEQSSAEPEPEPEQEQEEQSSPPKVQVQVADHAIEMASVSARVRAVSWNDDLVTTNDGTQSQRPANGVGIIIDSRSVSPAPSPYSQRVRNASGASPSGSPRGRAPKPIEERIFQLHRKPARSNSVIGMLSRWRLLITSVLSIADLFTDILVFLLWITREEYVYGLILLFCLFISCVFSVRSAPPSIYKRVLYFFQCGICLETKHAWQHESGHLTYSLKTLIFFESFLRAFPITILQMFSLVFDTGSYIWHLSMLFSVSISCLNFAFCMANYYKDRIRDKARVYKTDWSLNFLDRTALWICVSLDFFLRTFSLILILKLYSTTTSNSSSSQQTFVVAHYSSSIACYVIPFAFALNSLLYFFVLYGISPLFRDYMKMKWKSEIFLCALYTLVVCFTISPLITYTINRTFKTKHKIIALLVEFVTRIVLTLIFLICFTMLVYDIHTLTEIYEYALLVLAVVYIALTVYVFRLLFLVEMNTLSMRTMSQSMSGNDLR